jgi:hypothetical protein
MKKKKKNMNQLLRLNVLRISMTLKKNKNALHTNTATHTPTVQNAMTYTGAKVNISSFSSR